jgi:hypothetical protein
MRGLTPDFVLILFVIENKKYINQGGIMKKTQEGDDKIFEPEEDGVVEIPASKRKLFTSAYDYSVTFINQEITQKRIILEVPFQRRYIWKDERSSRLIESLIMNVPIPPIYLAEEDDGDWLVLDGLQRLNAIHQFINNKYKLTKMEILKELEGSTYESMPPKEKREFESGMLRINVIKKESHPDIKYDIFMRLNQGAVVLNDQELRNCMFRGRLNEKAKDIAGDNRLLNCLGLKEPDNRFQDVELVLRYLAISASVQRQKNEINMQGYYGSLRSLINDFMLKNNNASDDELKRMEEKVFLSLDKAIAIFGFEGIFRDPQSRSKKVNKAIFDALMIALEKANKKVVEKKAGLLRIKIEKTIKNDEFDQALRKRTADKSNIELRIKRIGEAIQLATE